MPEDGDWDTFNSPVGGMDGFVQAVPNKSTAHSTAYPMVRLKDRVITSSPKIERSIDEHSLDEVRLLE